MEFIKYCLHCLGIIFSGALGQNPHGMSFETVIIGGLTLFALVGLLLGILYLIAFIISLFD